MTYKDRADYLNRYEKETYRKVIVKLNKEKNADMIEYLKNIDNVGLYIKNLIRDDMKKHGK